MSFKKTIGILIAVLIIASMSAAAVSASSGDIDWDKLGFSGGKWVKTNLPTLGSDDSCNKCGCGNTGYGPMGCCRCDRNKCDCNSCKKPEQPKKVAFVTAIRAGIVSGDVDITKYFY
jgi:hypothetical protein